MLTNFRKVREKIIWEGSMEGILPILPRKLRFKKRSKRITFYFCPFHFIDGRKERKASFSWVDVYCRGLCFSCGAGPIDLIGFFAEMNGISYFQALVRLAKFYKIPLKWNKERLK